MRGPWCGGEEFWLCIIHSESLEPTTKVPLKAKFPSPSFKRVNPTSKSFINPQNNTMLEAQIRQISTSFKIYKYLGSMQRKDAEK